MNLEIEKWHIARHQEVKSAFGDLALEALIDISSEKSLDDIPGLWQPNSKQGTGLIAYFERNEEVCDSLGHIIEGKIELEADHQFLAIDQHRLAMATSQPGSPFLLAIYNNKHEAIEQFSHIEHFDYNEKHIYVGQLKEVTEHAFTFQHTADIKNGLHEAGRVHQSSAVIAVDIVNQHYDLRPFASGDINIIVFRDLTSDDDTYPVGRMLVVEQLDDSQVKLDFNKAFLPPCAFSPHFNCPMPPVSNRMRMEINAGEKKVVWKQ